jgi:hypothetical protein
MQRLMLVAVVTVLAAGSMGCHCCDALMRFEARKNALLFGTPDQEECCPEMYAPEMCEPSQCEGCSSAPGMIYQPQEMVPSGTYTAPSGTYSAPVVTPGPETYAPSL